jgi:hypothetical protein
VPASQEADASNSEAGSSKPEETEHTVKREEAKDTPEEEAK